MAKKDLAFSGLEAAIVLIAFVVVAAVFSYVMLGAGFFATQKSQEVTYSGIKQATSNIVLDGQIYGQPSTPGDMSDGLGKVTFYLSIPQGGQAQNLGDVDFVWSVGNRLPLAVTHDPASMAFTPSDLILTPGNKVKVELFGREAYSPVVPGDSFTLEVRPKTGAASLIQKTLATGYTGGIII
jgi:flagellin FlaB